MNNALKPKPFGQTGGARVDVRKRTLKDYVGQRVKVETRLVQEAVDRHGKRFLTAFITMRTAEQKDILLRINCSASKIVEQLQNCTADDMPFVAVVRMSNTGILHFVDPEQPPEEESIEVPEEELE